jgi:transposase-like protein
MKKTRNGLRRYSQEYKVAAVRRVAQGEGVAEVARDLGIPFQVLWKWRRVAEEKGEEHLHEWGRPKTVRGSASKSSGVSNEQGGRIAELEQLVGRQQMEIRFLDRALRRVEELRQPKRGDGGGASSKG